MSANRHRFPNWLAGLLARKTDKHAQQSESKPSDSVADAETLQIAAAQGDIVIPLHNASHEVPALQKYASYVVVVASNDNALDETLRTVVPRLPEIASGTQIRTGLTPGIQAERNLEGLLQAYLAKWENDENLPLLQSPLVFKGGNLPSGQYGMAIVWQSLGEEADAFVSELVRIARGPGFLTGNRSHPGFDDQGHNKRAYEIGSRLNQLGGMVLMKAVHFRVAAQIPELRGGARMLEWAWHRIGDWLA